MPKKEEKPSNSAKPNQDEKKETHEKQSPSKPPVEETESLMQDEAALQEAKQLVMVLESALGTVRAQIETERREGIGDPSVLQKQVEQAKMSWGKIQSDLEQAKDLSRKRKNEIDGWKIWYTNRSREVKPIEVKKQQREVDLQTLQREIKWRADELASNGEKINNLIPQELEARGVFEMANQKLAAFQAGVYKRSFEEDPRLKSVQDELKKAAAEVERLESKKPKQK